MATKLVSMEISEAEMKKRMEPATISTENTPKYPWGLSITLDQASLEKLGVSVADYKVGEHYMLIADVEVTSLSSSESKGGMDNQSVGLQICACCLEEDSDDDTAGVVKKLYDNSEA